MVSLLEATAALAIGAVLSASTLAALQQAVRLGGQAELLAETVFAERQFEALIDRAALSAGSGPAHPLPLGEVSNTKAEFRADLDGDGYVTETGSETSAVEAVNEASRVRLRHWLGHQTMTVVEFENASATVAAYDRFGNSTSTPGASLVEVRVSGSSHAAAGDDTSLRLLFAVPEALSR